MARKTKTKPTAGLEPNNSLQIEQTPDETGAQAMARKFLQPSLKNAGAASGFMVKMFGDGDERPGLHDYATHVQTVAKAAEAGDIGMVSQVLAAQALTLDAMFAELARRTAMNMGDYINASERYGRLALKAQSNCRATLEALVKLHQPREQTVRHVHVNEGGQAVIADQIHNHRGGGEHAESSEQCHGTGAAGESAALPSPDSAGNGMPIASREGADAMPHARRDKSRRA